VDTAPLVLVVDDDPELLKLVALLLRRIKVESATAGDGASAFKWLENAHRLDLIILDLMLPDVDGLEILRRLRGDAKYNSVPIIILSAKADPNTIRTGLDSGADGYITKPYLANSLISRVETLLKAGREKS
jgi:DNA-binding response OmpR family regulator